MYGCHNENLHRGWNLLWVQAQESSLSERQETKTGGHERRHIRRHVQMKHGQLSKAILSKTQTLDTAPTERRRTCRIDPHVREIPDDSVRDVTQPEEHTNDDDAELPLLNVVTDPQKKELFDAYMNSTHGEEVEKVFQQNRSVQRLAFTEPDSSVVSQDGHPSVHEETTHKNLRPKMEQKGKTMNLSRQAEKRERDRTFAEKNRCDERAKSGKAAVNDPHGILQRDTSLHCLQPQPHVSSEEQPPVLNRDNSGKVEGWNIELQNGRDWRDLPRDFFVLVVQTVHRENIKRLRCVCRTWRQYIDSEIQSVHITCPLKCISQPLHEKFEKLERLTLSEEMLHSSAEFHFPIKKLKSLNLEGSTRLHSYAFSLMVTRMKSHLKEISMAHTDVQDWKLHIMNGMIYIEKLKLNGTPVTKQTLLKLVPQMKNLTHLSLKACHCIDDSCMEDLAMVCPHLIELDVSENPALTFDRSEHISRFVSLKVLNICHCSPTDYGFRYLGALPSLSTLILTYDGSEKNGLCDFGHVRRDAGLANMLVYTPATVYFKKVMEGLMQLSPMTSLTVKGGAVHSNCVWWISYCDAITDLRVLRLQSVRNTADDKEFPALLRCSRLTELEIRHSSGITISFLAKLKTYIPDLKLLHISHCSSVHNAALRVLCRHPTLEDVDVSYCARITGRGLSEFANLKTLKKLNIAGIVFRNPDGLSVLKQNAGLEELNVSDCVKISVSCLLDVVQMPRLKTLIMNRRWFAGHGSAKKAIYAKATHPKFAIQFRL